MEDVSTIVAKLYEGHPYPPPILDLSKAISQGNYQVGDPTLWAPLLWPEGRPRQKLKILVAGCGTQQAAWFAFTNRDSDVMGVDLSEPSLAHHRYLQEKHALQNLRLFRGDLREVGKIGENFDLIICTGVLHHMADPDEGARALAGVMVNDGVLVGMVYAAFRRTGVYMMQDLFRRLEVKPDASGIAFARQVLASLPPWHFAHFHINASQDVKSDAGFVDTFLHPQDRAYTVPQVLALIEGNGLHFQGWFENALYYPEGSDSIAPELRARLAKIPERDQWASMELLMQWAHWHFFFARKRPTPAISFSGDAWKSYVPHYNPGIRRLAQNQFSRLGQPITLSAHEIAPFSAVDGVKTVGEIGAHTRQMFERLWKQGHIMVSKA
ncbi:MAG: hypothetical protein A4S17_10610 [Proteobacteria bacterium HN_bin10]|jgi:SAM-dependent methyltransferase|nr:MAG: hypothetical protein A4S17_10610 [Proteobacteria bacterium HN_bin10]